MSGKSRRKRSKQHPARKARGQQHPTTATRIPEVAPSSEPVARVEVTPSPSPVPARSATPQSIRFPYIAAELRTIGILAGIMLIALIVLYFTLV